jgi:hypothetical protein
MSTLKLQIIAQEQRVALARQEITEHWNFIKTETHDKLSSSNALIWSAIVGFVLGGIIKPRSSNLLFTFWPFLKKLGQPLIDKIMSAIH